MAFGSVNTINHYLDYEEDLMALKTFKNPLLRHTLKKKLGAGYLMATLTLTFIIAGWISLSGVFFLALGAVFPALYSNPFGPKIKKHYVSEYASVLTGYSLAFIASFQILSSLSLRYVLFSVWLASFFFRWLGVKDLKYVGIKGYVTLFSSYGIDKGLIFVSVIFLFPTFIFFVFLITALIPSVFVFAMLPTPIYFVTLCTRKNMEKLRSFWNSQAPQFLTEGELLLLLTVYLLWN